MRNSVPTLNLALLSGAASPKCLEALINRGNSGVAGGLEKGRTMKVHIDIDCTPEEARTLFGLPDVKPMQAALLKDVEGRMKKALASTEPEALVKMWMPLGIQSFEQWQKFLWSKFTGAAEKSENEGKTDKD